MTIREKKMSRKSRDQDYAYLVHIYRTLHSKAAEDTFFKYA